MRKPRVWFNDNNADCVAWLKELIRCAVLPEGDVDDRDLADVTPGDLRGYTQCHFFAGVGGWAYALALARWPGDEAVWTGSCPCQPFSVAGHRKGFKDARHLWPVWFKLIDVCRPPVLFGEQVSGPAGRGWLTVVRADLERAGYAVGAADLPAASVGAPHIRQRLYFVGDADDQRSQGRRLGGDGPDQRAAGTAGVAGGEVADTADPRRDDAGEHRGGPPPLPARPVERGAAGGLADDDQDRRDRLAAARLHERRDGAGGEPQSGTDGARGDDADRRGEPGDAGPGGVGIADGLDAAQERQGDAVVGGERSPLGRREQLVAGAGAAGGAGGGDPAGGTRAPGDGADARAPRDSDGVAEPLHAERRSLDVDREDGRDGEDPRRQEAHRAARARGEVRGDQLAEPESAGGRTDAGAVRGGPSAGLREPQGEDARRALGEAGRVGDCESAGELADGDGPRRGAGRAGEAGDGGEPPWQQPAGLRDAGDVANGAGDRRREERPLGTGLGAGDGAQGGPAGSESGGDPGELADTDRALTGDRLLQRGGRQLQPAGDAPAGFWDALEWLPCLDGKVRPVEPGTFPLAYGVPARLGRLRGYGNAIVPQAAQAFVDAYRATRAPADPDAGPDADATDSSTQTGASHEQEA